MYFIKIKWMTLFKDFWVQIISLAYMNNIYTEGCGDNHWKTDLFTAIILVFIFYSYFLFVPFHLYTYSLSTTLKYQESCQSLHISRFFPSKWWKFQSSRLPFHCWGGQSGFSEVIFVWQLPMIPVWYHHH